MIRRVDPEPRVSLPPPNTRRSLVALLLCAPLPTLGVIGPILFPGTAGSAIWLVCKLAIVAVPIVWRLRIDCERLSSSPLRERHGRALAEGAGLGLLTAGAMFLVDQLWHASLFPDVAVLRKLADSSGLGTPAAFIGGAVFWITVNTVIEEMFYRWFIFERARAVLGRGKAVIVASLVFATHHTILLAWYFGAPMAIVTGAGCVVGSVVWSVMYLRFRSLWPAYLAHAITDIPVFVIGYRMLFAD
jgi:membrane protease YdiL (CAAX protease family)